MTQTYYVDTSIWIDLLEDRKGFRDEPLGEYALKLFALIKAKKYTLILSDLLIQELESFYSTEEIKGMTLPFEKNIKKIFSTKQQHNEARTIAEERNLPKGDALHAILARDHKLIMVTRDKHFKELKDITLHQKPEEIIGVF